ncbi:unnamed protein product [Cercopithifilaria johnstoni]|uniref:Uncharacterized protein n=1 Tax=Cercopithifilaria johnstoni TaxID=2874296 RepID=A0A8J2Q425_9BILA|nr:unnamed protein product [Cercopithifilaria johnstoni]
MQKKASSSGDKNRLRQTGGIAVQSGHYVKLTFGSAEVKVVLAVRNGRLAVSTANAWQFASYIVEGPTPTTTTHPSTATVLHYFRSGAEWPEINKLCHFSYVNIVLELL